MYHKYLIVFLALALSACGSSDNTGGGGGGNRTEDACAATSVTEFFNALSGSIDFMAVDTFVENSDPATVDATFVDGTEYAAIFNGNDVSVKIMTENGEQPFLFDEAAGDMFGAHDHEINVLIVHAGIRLLIQQPCDDSGDPLFITYSDQAASEAPFPDAEFFWRLDAVTE